MSLLPKTGGRSDSTLSVQGCAIAHVMHEGAVAAAFHVRLPGSAGGARLGVFLQQLVASSKFQADVRAKGRLTVDDASTGRDIAVHCALSPGGLIVLVCTQPDYPTRTIFPSPAGGGLLARVGGVADDMLGTDAFVAGGRGAPGSVRRVNLGEGVTAALERACADYEDRGAHDSVARVQGEVRTPRLAPPASSPIQRARAAGSVCAPGRRNDGLDAGQHREHAVQPGAGAHHPLACALLSSPHAAHNRSHGLRLALWWGSSPI